MSEDRAIAPRRFDFASQTAEEFEELCFSLVRLEHPNAVRLRPPDHGLDCLIAGHDGAVERGWQAKRFTGNIGWGQCKESLEHAIERHRPRRITFCFARDLTAPQHELFRRNLADPHPELVVDYWGASELAARLNTEEGGVVARRFFGDPVGDADRIARAVRAGGDMSDAGDVLDRQQAIGEHLAGADPYFFYQSSVGEEDAPEAPPAPGTAVRLERVRDGVVARIDAQPRTPEALAAHGPAGRLVFAGDEEGRRALQMLERLRERGGQVELDSGVTFALDRLPPGLRDEVEQLGKPMPGRIILSAPKTPFIGVTVRVTGDDDMFAVPLELRGTDESRPEGELVLQGHTGGLTVTIRIDPNPPKSTGTLSWTYENDGSPAAEQLAALQLVAAFRHGGRLDVLDHDGRTVMSDRVEPAQLDPWLAQMRDIFETLVRIERMNDVKFKIPDEFDEATGRAILEVGRMLADRGAEVTWSDFKIVVRPEGLSKLVAGGPLRVTETLLMHLLGQEVIIGQRELNFVDYQVASTEAVGDDDDADLRITFVPTSEAGRKVWMGLVPADETDSGA